MGYLISVLPAPRELGLPVVTISRIGGGGGDAIHRDRERPSGQLFTITTISTPLGI